MKKVVDPRPYFSAYQQELPQLPCTLYPQSIVHLGVILVLLYDESKAKARPIVAIYG